MAQERDQQAGGQTWFKRSGGVVVTTQHDVTDPSPHLRSNGYLKLAFGEAPERTEARAIKAAKGSTFIEATPGGSLDDLEVFGFILSEQPRLFDQLDRLALAVGEMVGLSSPPLNEAVAWRMLAGYCVRAHGVATEEAGAAPSLCSLEDAEVTAEPTQNGWSMRAPEGEA